ncbi:SMI1/KNR4 family protein [Pseudoduganella armeniaca]|uniref:Knr4/Smi1-like domain-containing protein n=1 Tax=Pseudoduganella armeniaca TaxID=2072590 RepID=A0A2R4CCX5_9BURK|nr:SMI1/KNR4 family protein [Pseudoduganella armeniaca]AVR97445.1 hypothetical protein C9I28_18710 [Pseudoduganella armeniaca]
MSTPLATSEVEQLVTSHQSVINFGSPKEAVDEEWIAKAETVLKRKLPESYKWSLKRYAGGEIGGEELYSIYGIPFESVNGGDIVFQHLNNRSAGLLDDSKLVISETDFGEVFFFDYAECNDGECDIKVRLPSGDYQKYADDYCEFI